MEHETSHLIHKEQTLTDQKLDAIGMTESDFRSAVAALHSGDADTLYNLAALSLKHIEDRGGLLLSTQQQFMNPETGTYVPERADMHESILADVFAGHTPEENPTLTILAGPPGVGKSWFKQTSNDFQGVVHTDPDALKHRLLLDYEGISRNQVLSVHAESLDVAQLLLDRALDEQYSVLCESTLRHPDWTRTVVKDASDHGFNTKVVFLHRPFHDCFTNAFHRQERPVSLPFLLSSIEGYENLYNYWNESLFTETMCLDLSDSAEPREIIDPVSFLPILKEVTSLQK